MTVLVPDARQAMFAALIDYAGLYPPAGLDMAGAVAGYRAVRTSPRAWIAGRFICPASRLEELAAVLIETMEPGEPAWPVSVTFDLEPGPSASAASAFHAEMEPAASVHLAEATISPGSGAASVASLYTTALSISDTVVPFLEVPRDGAVAASLASIAGAVASSLRPGGAKLRCGGLSPEDFPSTREVAEFIIECVDRALPFKTTAGLHHPIRRHDEELDVMRHGFVNLLTAAAGARAGAGMLTVEAIIADTDPDAFDLSFGAVEWRGVRLGTKAIEETRRETFIAYGSCEFGEPVEDLAGLGMLP
jgi:hypothetical protein